MEQKNEIRLQKFLADNGIASRRKCEEIILQGRVKVNDLKRILSAIFIMMKVITAENFGSERTKKI